jgi:UrcA family protein
MMKKGLLVVAACCMASSAWAATGDPVASDPFVQQAAELRLDGIDFTTVEGQNRLAIRMDDAARAVCGDRLASVHLAVARQARECEVQVKADIRSQIEQRMAAREDGVRLASSR